GHFHKVVDNEWSKIRGLWIKLRKLKPPLTFSQCCVILQLEYVFYKWACIPVVMVHVAPLRSQNPC
ncbi:hypothetical protein AAAV69_09840, partial [[Ruminococcus] lactaris]|uniref:hypothetical protein n=1 Tax=[Ruminococcus] lactaris TaxID=46228 RepID=UPI0032C1DE0F